MYFCKPRNNNTNSNNYADHAFHGSAVDPPTYLKFFNNPRCRNFSSKKRCSHICGNYQKPDIFNIPVQIYGQVGTVFYQ